MTVKNTLHITIIYLLATISTLLAGCVDTYELPSDSELDVDQPLKVTAKYPDADTIPLTRVVSGKDEWIGDGTEEFGLDFIQRDLDYGNNDIYTTKTAKFHVTSTDGATDYATGETTIYWKRNVAIIKAWYPYILCKDETYPIDIRPQGNGFTDFDYLIAYHTNVPFTSDITPLEFDHAMAKVRVVVRQPSTGTVEISSVKVYGYINPKLSDDHTYIEPQTDTKGYITSCLDEDTDADEQVTFEGTVKGIAYEALVIPGEITFDQTFIVLTTSDNKTYSYTLASAKFEAGKTYLYNMFVGYEDDEVLDLSDKDEVAEALVDGNMCTIASDSKYKVVMNSAYTGFHLNIRKDIILADVSLNDNYYININDDATVIIAGTNNVTTTIANTSPVNVGDNVSFTIRGTEYDFLNAKSSGYAACGISLNTNSAINIEGGNIVATGGSRSAGLGTVVGSSECTINISGGNVTASSPEYGAGIGTGNDGSFANINISGGNVIASAGQFGAGIGTGNYGTFTGVINISGGNVTATGGNQGAGIGTGATSTGSTGKITISGGNVTATGGNQGAGIGSGTKGVLTDVISISGGTVNAFGGSQGAGIGTGRDGSCSAIEISANAYIASATGGQYGAGIGVSRYGTCNGDITISGGYITANGGEGSAGIGTGYSTNSTLTGGVKITGGTINATGGDNGAGIGSGQSSTCNYISISDAAVINSAIGGSQGAGIGTGYAGKCPNNILISGGNTTAIGGDYGAGIGSGRTGTCANIEISGGTIDATGGEYSPGIGSGRGTSTSNRGVCDDIIITGGDITAQGGYEGAGIGTGQWSTCDNISINGADVTITTTGGDAGAGIGTGQIGTCSSITISNSESISATGGNNGTGIGTGYDGICNGDITISGGEVTATGGTNGAGIGASWEGECKTITISGGKVTATGGTSGAGIGTGYNGTCTDIILINKGTTIYTEGTSSLADVGKGLANCKVTSIQWDEKATVTKKDGTTPSFNPGYSIYTNN